MGRLTNPIISCGERRAHGTREQPKNGGSRAGHTGAGGAVSVAGGKCLQPEISLAPEFRLHPSFYRAVGSQLPAVSHPVRSASAQHSEALCQRTEPRFRLSPAHAHAAWSIASLAFAGFLHALL